MKISNVKTIASQRRNFLHWSVALAEDFGNKEEEHRKYKFCLDQFTRNSRLLKSRSSELVQKLASESSTSLEVKTSVFTCFYLAIANYKGLGCVRIFSSRVWRIALR
ncbi:hypothetical protein Glove_74g227 [Diversispora epigaea]|uniref:Uncharacterized protein n=1 Tax=Diversispora epigaea TaxID=1348612 RepID=A0A397JAF5_9GLOM|nr:hypothetical protein Glove_74g227 [Diversispora epigaea]